MSTQEPRSSKRRSGSSPRCRWSGDSSCLKSKTRATISSRTTLSADGNTLLIGPGGPRLAFDLRARVPIKIGGGLKNDEFSSAMAFLGNDKVFTVSPVDARDSAIFSFPDGRRLQQVPYSTIWLQPSTGGNLLIAHGPQDIPAALVDLTTVKYVFSKPCRRAWTPMEPRFRPNFRTARST